MRSAFTMKWQLTRRPNGGDSALDADARQLELEALFGMTPEWIPKSRARIRAEAALRRKATALDTFRREIENCTRCGLAALRTKFVFGRGSPDAGIMLVGEAPGREEDLQGEPFVGAAGKILTRLIEGLGLDRRDVYIGNILKCRPPGNRNPTPEEMEACVGHLHRQIDIIDPVIIVAMGAVAARGLLDLAQPVGKMRGQTYDYRGRKVLVTYHPAYLLRNPSAESRVAADLQAALDYARAHPKGAS